MFQQVALGLATLQERLRAHTRAGDELVAGNDFAMIEGLRDLITDLPDGADKNIWLHKIATLQADMEAHNKVATETLQELAGEEGKQAEDNVKKSERYVHNVIAEILQNENIDPRILNRPRFLG